jgi:hypothetical protein
MSKRQKRTMGRRWRQQNQDPKERKQMLENLVTPPVSPSHPTEPGTSRLTRSFIRSPDGTESTPRTNRDIKIESAKKAKVSKCYRDLARKFAQYFFSFQSQDLVCILLFLNLNIFVFFPDPHLFSRDIVSVFLQHSMPLW